MKDRPIRRAFALGTLTLYIKKRQCLCEIWIEKIKKSKNLTENPKFSAIHMQSLRNFVI